MTSLVLAGLSVTVKVRFAAPSSPSATLGESMERDGTASSSVIVPIPVPVAIVAPSALPSATVTVSFGSVVVSPVTETVMVLLVSFSPKVRRPGFSAS